MLPSTLFAAVIVGTFESSLGYLAKYRMHKSEESEPAAEKMKQSILSFHGS